MLRPNDGIVKAVQGYWASLNELEAGNEAQPYRIDGFLRAVPAERVNELELSQFPEVVAPIMGWDPDEVEKQREDLWGKVQKISGIRYALYDGRSRQVISWAVQQVEGRAKRT